MPLKTLWGVTLLVALFASQVYAAERLTCVRAVLAEVDYPPFYYMKDDELIGISVEVLNQVADQLNLEIEYIRLSWPRVLNHWKMAL
ncbi:transporter substrate-binding domain-containing protein [Hahella ganghwensis]|uniref:transporter substrate-binding domain-containing protein n=1 Tax=Hahella ganghwensis TaxID=286420 RepID=UPI000376BC9C|nr:transporter substrate-binding domain-containing protein [Hahella ganghwensis]